MWSSDLISARIVALFMATSASLLMTTNSIMAQTNTPPQLRPAQGITANLLKKSQLSEVRGTDSEPEVKDRVIALEESLRLQNARLEAMEKIIAEQQRMIEALAGKQPNATPGKVAAAVPLVNATTATAAQTPSLDDRLKKVEGQVANVGPFKLSGDFRLRFDSILRPADNHPPPGLAPVTHQQNIRARYRFRLNLDLDEGAFCLSCRENDKGRWKFHAQLATGPINNALTNDQDFSSTTVRHPFFINEAWVQYRPATGLTLQGGRVREVFSDEVFDDDDRVDKLLASSRRFVFDDDVRFNGFNERLVFPLKKKNGLRIASVEARAGQYMFSNPNVAIVTAGSPLALAGAVVGTTGRGSALFHQGLVFNQTFNEKWTGQLSSDIQLYRNPNQIQLATTTVGVALIVQNGIGIALSGPITGAGNATTTAGGAIYTARNFQIARVAYSLKFAGFKRCHADKKTQENVCDDLPVVVNMQAARNVGIGLKARDALLGAVQVGRVKNPGSFAFTYAFAVKGANALISPLTDDDLGTNSGVNIRTHHFMFEYGLRKNVKLQSLLYLQRELRNSGDFPNFFVPLNAFTPRQYRFQEQIVFDFGKK